MTHSLKKSLHRTLWLLVSFCMVLPGQPQADTTGNWETVYQDEDLSVQRRDYRGSDLDEVKGVVRVKASLNALVALLRDASFNQQWVYRSGGARILQQSGYAQAYVYGVVDAPFPMSDRDTVVRFDFRQDPATHEIIITIRNQPDFLPAEPGLVRVPDMGGFWRLKPESDGWVEVTYQVYGDPGGWIPVWLANRAALLSVQHTLTNLKSVVGRYEGVVSEYVSEPDAAAAH
ncbi:MAG: START domain-containing protein [Halioglobus sp.]